MMTSLGWFYRVSRPESWQWQPQRTFHDPKPPILIDPQGTFLFLSDPTSYDITSVNPTSLADRVASAGTTTYDISGTATTSLLTRLIGADPGTYSLSSIAATLEHGLFLVTDAGIYNIGGIDATLVKASSGYTLTVDPGTYTIDAGAVAALLAQRLLGLDPSSYTISSIDSGLTVGRLLTTDSGTYIVGGANLSGSLTRLLTADPANYTLIGSDVGLRLTDIIMGAVPGVYVITGQAAYALLDIASFPGGSGGFIIIVND